MLFETSVQRKKRSKEWGTILPKSEIRTRGAKLPNFSLHLKIRPSRKDQRAIESSNLRMGSYGSACSAADALLTKSGGKKGRRELPPAFNIKDFPKAPPPIRRLRLENNPEHWTPHDTGKSLSEALIFASTNPQYDDRLFIDLQVQYMKTTSSEHGENIVKTKNNFCTQHVLNLYFSG